MAKDRFGHGTESFDKFRSGKWDSRKDYEYLKNMINTSYEDFKSQKPSHVPESSWNEEWVDVYKEILTAASQKEGAPPPEELHQTLREMQHGK
jgi:hypothetical protein